MKNDRILLANCSSEALLEAVPLLLPLGVRVVFLANRGFADTALLTHLRRLR